MKKIILIIFTLLIFCGCTQKNYEIDDTKINVLDYSNIKKFDFEINSYGYELIDMSNFKILYGDNYDVKIYPASLTKLVTLDTVLNCVNNLHETSMYSLAQRQELIELDASMAGLKTDYPYTIEELLYALILPSGADGAFALENYFVMHDMDLVEQMNIHTHKIGCQNSNFVNTTGLHDDNHYTSLNDLVLVILDILKFEDGRRILSSLAAQLFDETIVSSTVGIVKYLSSVKVLGGKTGYTDESGRSLVCLYQVNNRSYLLLLCNAPSDSENRTRHYLDALNIFRKLY